MEQPTPEEIEIELEKCKASPLYFLTHYVKVKNPQGDFVHMKLNKFQKLVYSTLKKNFWKPYRRINGKLYNRFQQVRLILVKPRQVGASSVIIGLILHDTLLWRGTESSIFLHKDEYSKKMLSRLKDMLDSLPEWMRPKATQKDLDSKAELYFSNTKARISVGTPGKSEELSGDKGRSETLNNTLISEMPRYPYPEDFMQGISAAARFGNQYIESTPLKAGDHFHELFTKAMNGLSEWVPIFVHWFDDERNYIDLEDGEEELILKSLSSNERNLMKKYPGRVTAGHIKWRRITIANQYNDNERRFIQEYAEDPETCFVGSGFNYFEDPEFEIKRVTIHVPNRTPGMIWFRDPIPGHFHILSADIAKGLGGTHDFNVIHISDYETAEQIAEFASNTISDKMMPFKIHEMWRMAPGMIGVEGNNMGEGVMATLRTHPDFINNRILQWMLWRHSRTQDGWYTSTGTKPTMVSEFYTAIKAAVKTYIVKNETPESPVGYRIASEALCREMGFYMDLGDGKYGADDNTQNHDDRVTAAMINVQLRKYAAGYREKFFEMLEEEELTWEKFREAS